MSEDIREKPYLTHDDIIGLNFIKTPSRYYFRRHYRSGLRSHIMEILHPEALERERNGVPINGIMSFPRARPKKVLRIFRSRFDALEEAEEEPRRVMMIESFLAPEHIARSNEFIVDYVFSGTRDFLLCGIQEYINGEVIDPWDTLDGDYFASLYWRMGFAREEGWQERLNSWIARVRNQTEGFVSSIRRLIHETGLIPDLAGVGNLILTREAEIKLVDINNVSRVRTELIPLDDRGYPVCDKSIEALFFLEQKILGKTSLEGCPLYRVVLDPLRRREVSALVKSFHTALSEWGLSRRSSYPSPDGKFSCQGIIFSETDTRRDQTE
ncbi:MAG: hypothetical protein ACOWYE_13165 [Desulfatiglandales bacterium]